MVPWFITSLENPLTLLVILVIVLVLFGAKRIPEVMHGLGKGLSEFKRGAREASDEVQRALNTEPAPKPAEPPVPAVEAPKPAEPSESISQDKPV
jgi:sec-independent protein translocase protein TatA